VVAGNRSVGTRIVGVVLLRNEDLFVEQAVRNVLDFCDEIVLCDHESRDGTVAILERLVAEQPGKLTLHRIADPSESHELIAPLAGEDVWVFGVDGDEVYDPRGLAAFRPRLLAGEFDDWWLIRGNVVHCAELDAERRTARGWPCPPSSSGTKLHNFRLIESWSGPSAERLHGLEGLRFKPPYADRKYQLHDVCAWDDSPFRMLHVCFLRRSNLDRSGGAKRWNVIDLTAPRRLPHRLLVRALGAIGVRRASPWKAEHYRQGPLVTVSAAEFFPGVSP
jgi:hypothetical protein